MTNDISEYDFVRLFGIAEAARLSGMWVLTDSKLIQAAIDDASEFFDQQHPNETADDHQLLAVLRTANQFLESRLTNPSLDFLSWAQNPPSEDNPTE